MNGNWQSVWPEAWEVMYRQRVSSSPQDVSVEYAASLITTLIMFRDFMKELPNEFRDWFSEIDDDYNELVAEASKAFYKLGWHDALQRQAPTEGSFQLGPPR